MGYSPVTQSEAFTLSGPLQLDTGVPLTSLGSVQSSQLIFAPDDFAQPSADLRFAATGTVTISVTLATYTYIPSTLDLLKLLAGVWKVQCQVIYTGGNTRFSTPVVLAVNPPL